MGKNCALGLEYSRPRAQFFPIWTSRPVNDIYLSVFWIDNIYFQLFDCIKGYFSYYFWLYFQVIHKNIHNLMNNFYKIYQMHLVGYYVNAIHRSNQKTTKKAVKQLKVSKRPLSKKKSNMKTINKRYLITNKCIYNEDYSKQ